MKKFFICLLIVCTICLSCFALTACDNKNTQSESSIEFITNYYVTLSDKPYNRYWFRFWYSFDLFKSDIKPIMQYKTSDLDNYKNFASFNIHAIEQGGFYAPDHYIYLKLEFDTEPKDIYIRAVSEDDNNILTSAYFNLEGTYKTA